MSIENQILHVGDWGWTIVLTILDSQTKLPVDVSGADTKSILIESPSDVVTAKTASFVTDGSDGKISYRVESDVIDEAGVWEFRGEVDKTGGSGYHYETSGVCIRAYAAWTP